MFILAIWRFYYFHMRCARVFTSVRVFKSARALQPSRVSHQRRVVALPFAACGVALALGAGACSQSEEAPQGRPLTRNFIADAAALALPAVVNVTSKFSKKSLFGVTTGQSAGSGFIVKENGA